MSTRGAVNTLAALLVLVAGCDDDPLAKDRDVTAYWHLNPTFAVVNVGGTTTITAIPLNPHGEPTGSKVEATACNASGLDIKRDSSRTDFEPPERFIVRALALGDNCVIVRSGGSSDTTDVKVVPASLAAEGGTIPVGGTLTVQVTFYDVGGNPVTGFGPSDLVFEVDSARIASVDEAGVVTGLAAGQARVSVELHERWGARRSATATIVVEEEEEEEEEE